ncbi:hypothetical protein PG995_012274 [Apiospora arundinis]
MAKLSLLSLILFAMMAVLGHGNIDVFSNTCKKPPPSLHFSVLTAYCPIICSALDLNHCYGYDFGLGIYPKDNGYFYQWCDSCTLAADRHTMSCACLLQDGRIGWWSIDLDLNIEVYFGRLRCYDHIAEHCFGHRAKTNDLNTTISAQIEANATTIAQSFTV